MPRERRLSRLTSAIARLGAIAVYNRTHSIRRVMKQVRRLISMRCRPRRDRLSRNADADNSRISSTCCSNAVEQRGDGERG